jgi:lipoate-protein ligase A
MKSFAIKMNNEKLVRISLIKEDDMIKEIEISGDFFIHPENGVSLFEDALVGKKIEKGYLKEVLDREVKDNHLELIGISTESIEYGILEVSKEYEK